MPNPPTIAHLQSDGVNGAWVTCRNPVCLRSTPVSFKAIGLAPETPFPAIARTRRFVCAACGSSRRGDFSTAPLTEPDVRATRPAPWIVRSKDQCHLVRYLRGVEFLPAVLKRDQPPFEPGRRVGSRHARSVGAVPGSPATIRGAGSGHAAHSAAQEMPIEKARSLLL